MEDAMNTNSKPRTERCLSNAATAAALYQRLVAAAMMLETWCETTLGTFHVFSEASEAKVVS